MTDHAEVLASELDAWCQSYVTAFSAYDAVGIESHWTFPALIIQGERSLVFKSSDHFTKNTEALLGFYKREGVARADRKLISCMRMGEATAAMTVEDNMLDDAGGEIVSWQAAYVLQQIGGKWRAVSAVADGESAAWAARGTPLGS